MLAYFMSKSRASLGADDLPDLSPIDGMFAPAVHLSSKL